jgi:hypothetical protein
VETQEGPDYGHHDLRRLARRGIELTQWGRDHASGKVKGYLSHYDDAARQVLLDRYGTAIIVSTESRSWTVTVGPPRVSSVAEGGTGQRGDDAEPG